MTVVNVWIAHLVHCLHSSFFCDLPLPPNAIWRWPPTNLSITRNFEYPKSLLKVLPLRNLGHLPTFSHFSLLCPALGPESQDSAFCGWQSLVVWLKSVWMTSICENVKYLRYLHKVKIELSHVQQMTSDQNINGVHIKLQLRRAIAHKPDTK